MLATAPAFYLFCVPGPETVNDKNDKDFFTVFIVIESLIILFR